MSEKLFPQATASSTEDLGGENEDEEDEDEVSVLVATRQAATRLFYFAVPVFLTASWLSADCSPGMGPPVGGPNTKMHELIRILIDSDSTSIDKRWPEISRKLKEVEEWVSRTPETLENMQMRRQVEIVQQMLGGQRISSDSGHRKFWDRFYEVENATDWFMDWSAKDNEGHSLEALLTSLIPRDSETPKPRRILIIGAGRSEVGPGLFRSGRRHVENVDISPVAVEHMKMKYAKAMPDMRWTTADVQSLANFKDGSFDFVFDKGTLDALGEDVERTSMRHAITEAFRVLRKPQVPQKAMPQPGFVSVTLQRFRAADLEQGAAQVGQKADCKEAKWSFGVRRMTIVTCAPSLVTP